MNDHSVTLLIGQLQSEKSREAQAAAKRLWDRYSQDLLELARRHLSARVRTREDEEDVLQSMYKSFVLRQQRGEYDLDDRTDLWRLLVVMTENKARNVATKHTRGKRNVRIEAAGDSSGTGDSIPSLLDRCADVQPSPDDAAMLAETLQSRLECLPEDLRDLALRKLEGYSNEELAGKAMMDCSVRTVERKLSRIRAIWGSTMPDGEDQSKDCGSAE